MSSRVGWEEGLARFAVEVRRPVFAAGFLDSRFGMAASLLKVKN
jgi:hypothetical protein